MNCVKCKAELPENAAFCPACGKKQAAAKRKRRKRANGTGTVSKLAGNRAKPWMARKSDIYIGTFKTEAEAEKALNRLTDTDISEKFNLTFQQIYDLWLPEHSRDIGPQGVEGYKSAFKNCTQLHDKKFRLLRHSDFQGAIIALEEKDLSKSTCEKLLQLFGQLSAWAIKEGIQITNYSQFCTIAAKQKTVGRVFPEATFRKIEQSDDDVADIAVILTGCGCRPGEFFKAETKNCFDDYFISGSKTPEGQDRVIPIADYALPRYQKLLKAAREKGYKKIIQAYPGNTDYKNFRERDFKPFMARLGEEGYTPYDCRHTYATWAVKAQVDKQYLRRIMGHKDLKTTDKHYTHLDTDDILAEARKVSKPSAVRNKSVTPQNEVKIAD